jgi:quercetin dioxygenase-like cupin family protein
MMELPPPLEPLPPEGADRRDPPAAVERARRRLRAAGVEPMTWSNAPGERYSEHEHASTKLLVCAEGEITFFIGADASPVTLTPGDGFVLPPGTRHSAAVGPTGCVCVEGHRR